ncbi:hypothetical protein KC850_02205 [Candidatus Kaiserbacteria bacterium]|nr:hypothetical protein [Candidatus Kaiserbacteria bacterium]
MLIALFSVSLLAGCAGNPAQEAQKHAEGIGTRIVRDIQTTVSNETTIPAGKIGGEVSVILDGRRRNIEIIDFESIFKTREIRPIPLPK